MVLSSFYVMFKTDFHIYLSVFAVDGLGIRQEFGLTLFYIIDLNPRKILRCPDTGLFM